MYTFPTTIYLALMTDAPTDAGGGTEVSYTGYARQAVAGSLTVWEATQTGTAASSGTDGVTFNRNAILFPVATSTAATITHLAVYDALTVGNLLWWKSLNTPVSIIVDAIGFKPVIPVSALHWGID